MVVLPYVFFLLMVQELMEGKKKDKKCSVGVIKTQHHAKKNRNAYKPFSKPTLPVLDLQ